MSEPKTMSEWVNRPKTDYAAADVAENMSTADLFRAHAECSHPPDRGARWAEALDAVCEALGKRVDAANERLDNLARALRGLDEKARMALYAAGINPGIGDP